MNSSALWFKNEINHNIDNQDALIFKQNNCIISIKEEVFIFLLPNLFFNLFANSEVKQIFF